MKPIIQNSHMSEANKKQCCTHCKKEMPSDNYWMMFGGGWSIHRHFHDNTGKTIDIIDNDVGQQSDVGFCSKECTKAFLVKIAEGL